MIFTRLILAACLFALSAGSGAERSASGSAEFVREIARIQAELEATRRAAEESARREARARAAVERLEARLAAMEGDGGSSSRKPGVRHLDGVIFRVSANSNLRVGPGLGYPVKITLPKGATVRGYGILGEWVRVRNSEHGGGWIHRELLADPS